MKFSKVIFIAILMIIIASSVSFAQLSEYFNYQGVILDSEGNPVADGTHSIKFTIWANSTSTDPMYELWTSGFQSVQSVDGLVSYNLGENVYIPNNIFAIGEPRYLGITIGTDSEITPRIRMGAAKTAMNAIYADTLIYDRYLNETGDTLTGNLHFLENGIGGQISIGSDYANISLRDNGELKTHIYGELYGEVNLRDNDGTIAAGLHAGNATSSSAFYLKDSNGTSSIGLFGRNINGADNMVQFPDSAINADEILNEAGIAHSRSSLGVGLIAGTMTNISTTNMTLPTAGYVFVIGTCYMTLSGGGDIYGYAQIDTSSYGGLGVSYTKFGSDNYSESYTCLSVSVQRVFYLEAGFYNFMLEGMESSGNDAGTSIYGYRGNVTAIFVPSAYGYVTGAVTSAQASQFEDATLIESTNEEGKTETYYEVDLRELEIKAKQKRIEALEAEMELRDAQEEAARNERSNNE